MALILMLSQLERAREVNYSLFSESVLMYTPDDKADMTLKKVETDFLGLKECPGFRRIPEACWQTHSQILNRCQRVPRVEEKELQKKCYFRKDLNVTLKCT